MHHVITHHISETLANYHFEKSYLQLFRFVICQLPQLVSIGLGEIFFLLYENIFRRIKVPRWVPQVQWVWPRAGPELRPPPPRQAALPPLPRPRGQTAQPRPRRHRHRQDPRQTGQLVMV